MQPIAAAVHAVGADGADRPERRDTIGTIDWPPGDHAHVPCPLFKDPAVYAREQARIFRGRCWSFLCLEAEIPAPGDFRVADQRRVRRRDRRRSARGLAVVLRRVLVARIVRDGALDLFASGKYLDRLRLAGPRLVIEERVVVLDSSRVDTLLALPL